jgi:hypothetical protein
MSLHINRFIDRLRAAEGKQQRDIVLSLNEARDLHGDITKLLLIIQELREQQAREPQIQTIEVEGGSF